MMNGPASSLLLLNWKIILNHIRQLGRKSLMVLLPHLLLALFGLKGPVLSLLYDHLPKVYSISLITTLTPVLLRIIVVLRIWLRHHLLCLHWKYFRVVRIKERICYLLSKGLIPPIQALSLSIWKISSHVSLTSFHWSSKLGLMEIISIERSWTRVHLHASCHLHVGKPSILQPSIHLQMI